MNKTDTKIAQENEDYWFDQAKNKPTMLEELLEVLKYQKDLTTPGFKNLVKLLQQKGLLIANPDKQGNHPQRDLINLVFTIGVDEGFRESIERLSLRPEVLQVLQQKPEIKKPTRDKKEQFALLLKH